MKRLTIHLKNVSKIKEEGKYKIYNTLSFKVRNNDEATMILARVQNESKIKKHYLSNIY